MDIKYSKNTERPVALLIARLNCSFTISATGEYDRNLTDIVLITGDEYKVKHNGSEYTCTAWAEDGKVHIGGKGEPFDIYNFDGDIYAMAQQDGHNKFEVYHEKLNGLPYDAMPAGYPGVKTEMVEIVPQQSVTLNDGTVALTLDIAIEAGKKYTVMFNDVKYECVGIDMTSIQDFTCYGLVDNNDVEQPSLFVIAYIADSNMVRMFGGNIMVQVMETDLTNVKFSIATEQEVVKPMDIKYLPIEELKKALGIG